MCRARWASSSRNTESAGPRVVRRQVRALQVRRECRSRLAQGDRADDDRAEREAEIAEHVGRGARHARQLRGHAVQCDGRHRAHCGVIDLKEAVVAEPPLRPGGAGEVGYSGPSAAESGGRNRPGIHRIDLPIRQPAGPAPLKNAEPSTSLNYLP